MLDPAHISLLTERRDQKDDGSINIAAPNGAKTEATSLIDKLKNVFLFKRNLILLQPSEILFLERPSPMMLFLILNVSNDSVQLRMSVGKSSVAFLP